jgi:phage shock protein A
MLDMAQAEAELNATTASSEVDSLSAKYDATPDSAVQDELAALKAQLGQTSEQ